MFRSIWGVSILLVCLSAIGVGAGIQYASSTTSDEGIISTLGHLPFVSSIISQDDDPELEQFLHRLDKTRTEIHRAIQEANRQVRLRKCDAPNVVLIVIDDLGYGDLGCYGQQKIKTPHIDQLAKEGIRFTQFYAGSSVGTPSRCSLHTGYHTGHSRLRGNKEFPLQDNDHTIAEVLWEGGYETVVFGSWALGDAGTTGSPLRQGYVKQYGYLNRKNARNYYPEFLYRDENKEEIGNKNNQQEKFSHDLVTEEVVKYLQRKKGNNLSFFLHVSFTPPHIEVGQVPDVKPYQNENWPEVQKQYAAMITRVDRSVGKIMKTLEERKLLEDTIVILTSDNGPQKKSVDPKFFESAGKLRGHKGSLFEGGLRVPMIVRSSVSRVKPGAVNDHVWAAWDLLPTLIAVCHCNRFPKKLDGRSQRLAWLGRPASKHKFLYWELHENGFQQAVRYGKWKAVRTRAKTRLELYDLKSDPQEKNNIAADHEDIVQIIEQLMKTSHTASSHWSVN